MTLKTTTIFNFALETTRTTGETNPLLATQATLYDSKGREVHRIVSINDATSTSNSILLLPGKYFLRINTVSQNKAAFKGVAFRLLGSVISNPVGPIGTNPLKRCLSHWAQHCDDDFVCAPVYVSPLPTISMQTESPFLYQPPTPPTLLTLAPPVYNYQNWYWQFSMTDYSYPVMGPAVKYRDRHCRLPFSQIDEASPIVLPEFQRVYRVFGRFTAPWLVLLKFGQH